MKKLHGMFSVPATDKTNGKGSCSPTNIVNWTQHHAIREKYVVLHIKQIFVRNTALYKMSVT